MPLFDFIESLPIDYSAQDELATRVEKHTLISELQQFEEYKESGQEWLGLLPRHWSVLPNRALFNEVNDRNHPDEEMLSVTITRGIVRQSTLLANTSKKDSSNSNKSAYKLVQPNDIAYNKMRAWQGALGASTLRGIISPAYVVIRPRTTASTWYYHHLYRTPAFAKEAERWSYGITSDMWSLRPEHFKLIYSPSPPPDEQAAIVRFLDHANRKIDRFIRSKRKMIALLNEQKQAIIHHGIDQGINGECGCFPMRAVLRPVKRFGYADKVLLSLFRDYGVIPKDSRENKNVDVRDLDLCQLVLPGDVVMNKMKAWQGSIAVSDLEGIVSPDYMVLEFIRDGIDRKFFHYLLRSPDMVTQYRRNAYGVRPGQWRLMYPEFCRLHVHIPSVEEQERIVKQIEDATSTLNKGITRTEREIALMQEFRTRLTADVVTGKLDVRAAAAKLPELEERGVPEDEGEEPDDELLAENDAEESDE